MNALKALSRDSEQFKSVPQRRLNQGIFFTPRLATQKLDFSIKTINFIMLRLKHQTSILLTRFHSFLNKVLIGFFAQFVEIDKIVDDSAITSTKV